MVNLIITVIAIAFFAAIMFAGSGYVNFDSISALRSKTELTSSLSQLATGVSSYKMLHDVKPEKWDDFVPSLIGKPSLPKNMEWTEFKLAPTSGYNLACISVDIDKEWFLNTILDVQRSVGNSQLIIGEACGDTINNLPIEFPSTRVITYTIR